MNITRISVHCPDDDVAQGTPDQCNLYRAWLAVQLRTEYPGATVEVTSKPGWLEVVGDNVTAAQVDQVERFIQSCWDVCPWNFI